jgi:uncharacterized membrane protein
MGYKLLAAMVVLDFGAAIAFAVEGKYALAVIFCCATIGNIATFWLI